MRDVDASRLPASWRSQPPPAQLVEIGRRWLASGSSLALRVPSTIVPVELNVLIATDSGDLARCSIGPPEPFSFDPRLL